MRVLPLLSLVSLSLLPAMPGCASASDPATTTVVIEGEAGAGGEGGSQGQGGENGAGQGGAGTQGGAGQGEGGKAASGQGGSGAQGGQAGQGTAGSGQAGQGNAGQGTAGSGQAGSGTAGSGVAGQGTAGQGQAGSGQAGQGQAGQEQGGQGGSGQAGQGQAGGGQAGGGQAGAGGAADCAPLTFLSGVKIATRPDPGLTALYEDLNVSTCAVPVCFIDTLDLKDDQGNPLDIKVKLAPHFALYELIQTEVDPNKTGAVDPGNAYSTTVLVEPDLLEHLEQLRINYGGPVNLTSGFRSPPHQKAVCQSICGADQCTDASGQVTCARNSRHMWGAAADMSLTYETAASGAGFAFVFHENGGTGPHLHVDMQSCQ